MGDCPLFIRLFAGIAEAEFWKEKMEDAVRSYDGLSPQFGILVELRSQISVDLFVQSDDLFTVELERLVLEGKSAFTEEEFYCIALSLEDIEVCHSRLQSPAAADEEYATAGGNCTCNSNNNCNTLAGETCGSNCSRTFLGCGFWLLSPCTGTCGVGHY